MKVGDVVQYTDEHRVTYPALVTYVHSEDMINIVTLEQDAAKVDPYGRQIKRNTSVPRFREGYAGIYFTQ